jgi:hypothetical protein
MFTAIVVSFHGGLECQETLSAEAILGEILVHNESNKALKRLVQLTKFMSVAEGCKSLLLWLESPVKCDAQDCREELNLVDLLIELNGNDIRLNDATTTFSLGQTVSSCYVDISLAHPTLEGLEPNSVDCSSSFPQVFPSPIECHKRSHGDKALLRFASVADAVEASRQIAAKLADPETQLPRTLPNSYSCVPSSTTSSTLEQIAVPFLHGDTIPQPQPQEVHLVMVNEHKLISCEWIGEVSLQEAQRTFSNVGKTFKGVIMAAMSCWPEKPVLLEVGKSLSILKLHI